MRETKRACALQDVWLHQPEPLPAVRHHDGHHGQPGHPVGAGGHSYLPQHGTEAGLRGEHPGTDQGVLHQPGQEGQGASLQYCRGEARNVSALLFWNFLARPEQSATMLLRGTFPSSTFTSETPQWWVGQHTEKDEDYWDDLCFLEYERRLKMSLVDYISSVGGLFGLFLGFSLLSFLEIVYWLGLNLIRNLFQPNKQTTAATWH